MSFANDPALQRDKALIRSSLACLLCRSRHRKCDGMRPHCSRCVEAGTQCHYPKSRRGGLDRAALAERRKRLAAAGQDPSPAAQSQASNPPVIVLAEGQEHAQDHAHRGAGANIQHEYDRDLRDGSSGKISSVSLTVLPCKMNQDPLIDSYYKAFHRFHPLVLPRSHLVKLFEDPTWKSTLTPLIAVLRFIGYLYDTRDWSTPLQKCVEDCLSEAPPADPFLVQCRLLYSIVLFWSGHSTDSKLEMECAVRLALQLKIFRQEFATEYGGGDVVLAESWRRTWWTLYVVDGYYAGTLGTMKSAFMDVEITAELPCEETEYESGEIPEPRTLQEFDCREFAFCKTSYSSFAYLIGAVRCVVLATSIALEATAKDASTHVIQSADAILDGWVLSIPKGCKQVLAKNGEIDELMFQAHLVILVSMINLHRPLSDLKSSPVEEVSSCARDPPKVTQPQDLVNVHTVRVLRSIDSQIRLLALPARPFNHTPFITCMVSEGTLALLSACNFLLKGRDLAIARHQIHMTIGCLGALAEYWPRIARNLQEIQIIARQVLGLVPPLGTSDTPKSDEVPSLSSSEAGIPLRSEADASNDGEVSFMDAIDSLYGWYDLGDLDVELSRWTDG